MNNLIVTASKEIQVSIMVVIIIAAFIICCWWIGEKGGIHQKKCRCQICKREELRSNACAEIETIKNMKFTKVMANKLKKHNIKNINGDYVLKRQDGINVVLSNYDIYNAIGGLK